MVWVYGGRVGCGWMRRKRIRETLMRVRISNQMSEWEMWREEAETLPNTLNLLVSVVCLGVLFFLRHIFICGKCLSYILCQCEWDFSLQVQTTDCFAWILNL